MPQNAIKKDTKRQKNSDKKTAKAWNSLNKKHCILSYGIKISPPRLSNVMNKPQGPAWGTLSNSGGFYTKGVKIRLYCIGTTPLRKIDLLGAGFIVWGQDILGFLPTPCGCGCISRQKYTPNHSKKGPYAHGRGKFNSTHRSPQAPP